MSDFLRGALVGEIMLFAIVLLAYYSEIKYDFSLFLNKHKKSILISILVAGCLGGLVAVFDNGSGSSCKSFGRFASSC